MLSSEVSLKASLLVAEPMCVVVGRGHPLFARPKTTLAEVQARPWALPHVSSHLRGLVDGAGFDSGAQPMVPQVECHGIHNLLAIAAAAGMPSPASRSEVFKPAWRGRAVALDLPLRLRAPRYGFVSRRCAVPVPEVLALRTLAVTAAQRLLELPGLSSRLARARPSAKR